VKVSTSEYRGQLLLILVVTVSAVKCCLLCRWWTWQQPKPEWLDRAGSGAVVWTDPCSLHHDKQRHCSDGLYC